MIRSISLLAMLYFVQPWVLLACFWGCCWLMFSPVGPPSPAPHLALPLQKLSPSRGWDRTRTLSCWMSWGSCRASTLAALPSTVSTTPLLCSRLREEGERYQKLTQKEKFWRFLQPVAGTGVRRLTNVDDISSFLALMEKKSCKCKHVHTFEPSTYRYASTDVDSNALYDKIFDWGGERGVKFKILLLLRRLLNYGQPLVPCE